LLVKYTVIGCIIVITEIVVVVVVVAVVVAVDVVFVFKGGSSGFDFALFGRLLNAALQGFKFLQTIVLRRHFAQRNAFTVDCCITTAVLKQRWKISPKPFVRRPNRIGR